jgi:hypothetical protein
MTNSSRPTLFAIVLENGALLAPEGHWTSDPRTKIAAYPRKDAEAKVEWMAARGIKCEARSARALGYLHRA